MFRKSNVVWGLLSVCLVTLVLGCSKPSNPGGATKVSPDQPAAHTTDSK